MRRTTIYFVLALACVPACEPERAGENAGTAATADRAGNTTGTAGSAPAVDRTGAAGDPADRGPEPGAPGRPAVPASPADSLGPAGAVAVVRDYYAAIARRDYARAYRHWGGGGAASGQTFEAFRRGFAETASVAVEIGEPGRIEAAAGSRYIEVPVTVRAVTTAGERQRFEGTYVLRRAVVEGATAEQRAWHIDSADIVRIE